MNNQQKSRLSLGLILNVYSVILVVTPIVFVVLVAVTLFRQQASDHAIDEMRTTAEVRVQDIRRWLGNSQTTLSLILANPEQYRRIQDILLSGGNPGPRGANVQRFLMEQLALQSAFEELFFYNLRGVVRVSTASTQMGRNIQTQPYFNPDLAADTIHPPYYDPERAAMTALLQRPIYHPSGHVLGVMVGRLNLQTLSAIMSNTDGADETTETYLVSQVGQNLITPSRFEPYDPTKMYQSFGIETALTEVSGASFYENYRGREVIGVYLWLPELEAALLAEVETVEEFAAINQVQTISLGIGALASLLAVAMGVGFTNWLVKPIKRLTEMATAIAEGDHHNRQLKIRPVAEIGRLAQAFETMTSQLVTQIAAVEKLSGTLEQRVAAQTARLETVAALGERFSAILDVDDILHESVNQVKEKFGYYHAHVYLLDEAQAYLVMMAGVGEAGAQMKTAGHKIPLEAQTSLVARSARNREVVLVDNVREAPDWLPNKLLPDTYSEMAVPIVYEAELLGVLDVQQDRIAGLDDGDASLLRSVANYIGVAIHNARLYEAMARTNADKDKFFSIVAHDLKGPFTPVMGNAELLAQMADVLPTAEIQKMSQSIHRSARTVFRLLENLLTWARMQMGRMEYQPQDLSLKQTAAQTVDVLTATANQKGVTLHNSISADMFVYADPNMLDTVIRNVTNNAIKFTPKGGQVTIEAQPQPVNEADATPQIAVAITDTGVGISPENLDKLFKLDSQHTTTGTDKESGTGLGLLLCKELVEQHGGQIWVESTGGEGTTVRFTIPVGDAAAVDTAPHLAPLDADDMESPSIDQAAYNNEAQTISATDIMKLGDSISQSARGIYTMLDDLFSWVATELSWLPHQPAKLDLVEILRDNETQLAEQAAKHGVTFESYYERELFVYGDRTTITIIIQGLLLNALKFASEQGRVSISAVHRQIPSSRVEVAIVDAGRNSQPRAMSSLWRIPNDNASNEAKLDVGLGLVIYRELVERNGGQIWMEQPSAEETVIKFTLPVQPIESVETIDLEKFYHIVMDSIPQAIFWKNRDSVYLGCNQQFATIAGLDHPQKIIGMTDYDLPWKPEETEFFRNVDRRVMEANRAEINLVEPQLQASGRQTWVNTNKIPLHDGRGRVIGILGTFADITQEVAERESVEEEIRLLQLILNALPQAAFWKDTDSVYLGGNYAFVQDVGLTSIDQLAGKTDYDLPWADETAETIIKYDQQVIEQNRPHQYQRTAHRNNGQSTVIETSLWPLHDTSGNVVGVLGVYGI